MASQTDGARVRVMTYNVRSLRDGRARVAAVIRACAPDVVCIQEAPRFLRWRSKCAALARESQLVVVTGGRTAGATLLLSGIRVRVRQRSDVLLSRTRRLHQRGLAMADLELDGARFGVASMHLGLDETERARHVDEVFGHLSRMDVPQLVLAGDLNERPGQPRWQAVTARLRDGWQAAPSGGELTFPARRPSRRIDGVFVSAGLQVLSCGVPSDVDGMADASDHLPVVADVLVPRG
jgi:endonuclease/exonuclease/phosphatase family metal-dependent hydrolase